MHKNLPHIQALDWGQSTIKAKKKLRLGCRMRLCNFLSPYLIVTCGHPFRDKTAVDSDSIMIMGYTEPALEGTVLSFDCPPQYALSGPNTTTCMGNGEWEPDPSKAECKGMTLCYTIIISLISSSSSYGYTLKRLKSLGIRLQQ